MIRIIMMVYVNEDINTCEKRSFIDCFQLFPFTQWSYISVNNINAAKMKRII